MFRLAILLLTLSGIVLVDTAEARWFRRSHATHARHHHHRSQLPRPVTGYGANLHRNFILKQELRRARAGHPVRSRGNILWYRH